MILHVKHVAVNRKAVILNAKHVLMGSTFNLMLVVTAIRHVLKLMVKRPSMELINVWNAIMDIRK